MSPGRATSGRGRASRGAFVLVVGPDGSGKSTLARRLVEATSGDFTAALHIHWRPEVLPRLGSLVGVEAGDPSEPHAREPRGRFPSAVLLAYHWLDFLLGAWLRILPMRRRGGLVVMERGWPDIGVDPRRYRLRVSSKVVEQMGRLLPAPDVVLVLQADPEVLMRRKRELPIDELARQLRRWEHVRFPHRTSRSVLDVSRDKEAVLAQATSAVLST